MRIIWLITICTASSWLYMLSTFTPAELSATSPFVFLLLAGIATTSVSLRKTADRGLPHEIFYFAIPLTLICFCLPFPYSLGAYVMLAGLFINLMAYKIRRLAPLSAGLLITGLILLVQSACMPLVYVISSRFHEIKLLNRIAWPLASMLGLKAGMSESIIYLPFFKGISAFPGTLEKTGFYLLFHIFIGGIILLGLLNRKRKSFARLFAVCLGYCILRYVFLIFVMAQVDRAEIFWNPVWLTLSYFPLAVLLGAFMPLKPHACQHESLSHTPILSKKILLSVLLFFIGVFCFIGMWAFNDPGNRKAGRILIDEKHSDWEWSSRKFDTSWFGSQSTYNYYCMAEYLNHFYTVNRNHDSPLSRQLLSNCDVLILKTPTQAYKEEEIEAIVEFVRDGGGLWLIGDHTNVFGINYYLNFIAKRFGMFFHYDSTYDLKSGTLTMYRRTKVFPHPIVQDMPPFLFATSCTADAPLAAENVMIGYGLRSRMLSYSGRAFFEQQPLQDYEFGLFLQSAAVKHGRGRVTVFTDSTCFSNFYMFIPGKPELVIGTMEWLNRKNRYDYVPFLMGITSLMAILLGIFTVRKEKGKIFPLFLFSALCAASAGVIFFTYLTKASYAFPDAHKDLKKVIFETGHSDFTLPIEKLVEKDPKNIHTFYVWTQRMGYFPSIEKNFADALKKNALVILVNPCRPFSEHEIDRAVHFVEQGGRLLILDGPQNKNSTSNQLLKKFKIHIDFTELKKGILLDRDNKAAGTAIRSGSVRGGEAFLKAGGERPVFSVVKRGKGVLGVMADSYLFTNLQMGGTQVKPSEKQLKIYSLEFYVLRTIENY